MNYIEKLKKELEETEKRFEEKYVLNMAKNDCLSEEAEQMRYKMRNLRSIIRELEKKQSDIEILKETLKEFKTYGDLDGIQDLRPFMKALEHAITALKENQAYKDRIKQLEKVEKLICKEVLINTTSEEFKQKYIPKALVKEKKAELEWVKETDKCNCDECRDLRNEGRYMAYEELLGEKQ